MPKADGFKYTHKIPEYNGVLGHESRLPQTLLALIVDHVLNLLAQYQGAEVRDVDGVGICVPAWRRSQELPGAAHAGGETDGGEGGEVSQEAGVVVGRLLDGLAAGQAVGGAWTHVGRVPRGLEGTWSMLALSQSKSCARNLKCP